MAPYILRRLRANTLELSPMLGEPKKPAFLIWKAGFYNNRKYVQTVVLASA